MNMKTIMILIVFGVLMTVLAYNVGQITPDTTLQPAILGAAAILGSLVFSKLLGTTGDSSTVAGKSAESAGAGSAKDVKDDSAAAIQILSILQRKGRLIDFLQEDLSQHEDAQIGAAARTIHEGCRTALNECLDIGPLFNESEGSTVKLEAGFDAAEVKLVGNVSGEPPFSGTLIHKGWRVKKVKLPKRVADNNSDNILAAAEVEL